ncbi:hypothetical protein TNCV_3139181 [Trichonephila clavipes]|nr:hypothetical protein TNCV_3139181 [Trichonephila clavipes]
MVARTTLAKARNLVGPRLNPVAMRLPDEEEIRSIKKQISLPPKSPLRSLHPFIDEHGLVRVGGRLQNSQLQFNSKHPIILPSQHSISELLIKE